jgi:hypothetical protein
MTINTFITEDGGIAEGSEGMIVVHSFETPTIIVHSFQTSPPRGEKGLTGPIGGVSSTLTTRLLIKGSKSTSSVYSVTSSGVNYAQEGDDGLLSDSAEIFNASCSVFLFLNGLNLTKGTQVIWLSPTSFQLEADVDNGDEIVILS